MGACIGFIKKKPKKKSYFRFCRCAYFHEEEKVELEVLVERRNSMEETTPKASSIWNMSGRISSSLLRKTKISRYKKCNEEDNGSCDAVECCQDDGDSQLLPLDAHTLLASRAVRNRTLSFSSTTPPSSIDLEWENEGFIMSNNCVSSRGRSQTNSNVGGDSSSGCIGSASPDSLEWDDETDNLETHSEETERLLAEIERFTEAALRETADWN